MARKPRLNPERLDADNPEWTAEDFAQARPAAEVLPARLLRKVRGPQKTPTKERVTIRLSRDVLARFRADGPGWQGRIDEALRRVSERSHRRSA
jgi:uncharacterized protein (DUF4415 family)